MYQRKSKSNLLQEQLQSREPEVRFENDYLIGDFQISNTCDVDPNDLHIALRKDKRLFPSKYRVSYFSICFV